MKIKKKIKYTGGAITYVFSLVLYNLNHF